MDATQIWHHSKIGSMRRDDGGIAIKIIAFTYFTLLHLDDAVDAAIIVTAADTGPLFVSFSISFTLICLVQRKPDRLFANAHTHTNMKPIKSNTTDTENPFRISSYYISLTVRSLYVYILWSFLF